MEAFKSGQRVKLRRSVERFPFFVAKPGLTGTVVEAQESLLCVKMDEHLEGAEEWQNEIAWQDLTLEEITADLEVLDSSEPIPADAALVQINEAREGRMDWAEINPEARKAIEAEAERLGLDFEPERYDIIALADAVVVAR